MEALRERVVIRSVHCGDLQRLLQMDEQITGKSRRDWFERKLRFVPSDVRISLGAEVDGALVGAILCSLRNGESERAEPTCVFDAVLVDRLFRGRGIAAVLLERLAENLRGLGIDRWRTEFASNQHALGGFLGDKGFLPSPRAASEYQPADSDEDSFPSIYRECANPATAGAELTLQAEGRAHR